MLFQDFVLMVTRMENAFSPHLQVLVNWINNFRAIFETAQYDFAIWIQKHCNIFQEKHSLHPYCLPNQ